MHFPSQGVMKEVPVAGVQGIHRRVRQALLAHVGGRQLLLPLTTIILAGLEPSSLVHHHAV
jgi:hypothetical protein